MGAYPPRTLSKHVLSLSFCFQVQRCFTATETIRTVRDGEPRTATSTFTQLLSSEGLSSSSMLLYVHRDRKDYQGRGAHDDHLSAPELRLSSWCWSVALCPPETVGLLGTGAQDVHLDFHTACLRNTNHKFMFLVTRTYIPLANVILVCCVEVYGNMWMDEQNNPTLFVHFICMYNCHLVQIPLSRFCCCCKSFSFTPWCFSYEKMKWLSS